MSYELEFEAEPFAMNAGAKAKRGCGCAKCTAANSGAREFEDEVGSGGVAGAIAGVAKALPKMLPTASARIIDLTAKAEKSLRKGKRDPKTVTALVLHQMACCAHRKDPLNSYLKINSHYSILRDGRILQMHPDSAVLWASHGFNNKSVAVEFAGNFPSTKGTWWQGDKYGKNTVTKAQVEAGRSLIQHLMKTIGIKHVLTHRQSSDSRTNDPGPDIWFHVGQWAVDKLGIGDGGPGFKIHSGSPIPDAWRKWNKPVANEVMGEFSEEIDELSDMEVAHDHWNELTEGGEFEFSDELNDEAGDEFELPRRTVGRSTRPPSRTPPRRPPTSRRPPSQRSRLARVRGNSFTAASNAPCICPQHGSEFVRWLQSSLNQVLGTRLPVTGLIDAATRSAIRSFQQQRSLSVDGIAGPELKKALVEAKSGAAAASDRGGTAAPAEDTPDANEMLEFEDAEWDSEVDRNSSAYVAWVQSALNQVNGAGLAVDGISGTLTRSAIRSFQSKQGLPADGIVGSPTESALVRAGAAPPPASAGNAPSSWQPTPSAPRTSFITIRSGVQLNPATETAVRGLDVHFKRANLPVTLTSAVRSAESQLNIIRSESSKRGIDQKYPAIRTATVDNIESWRGAWDELLNRHGFIVNPPKSTTSRITGRAYNPSPHIAGTAMDFSGADLDRIADVVRGYCREGGQVSQILIERTNNAVHVGVAGRGGC
jgi:peptidoglycan hydrolase-like protein with peptidoglycan-binding domain